MSIFTFHLLQYYIIVLYYCCCWCCFCCCCFKLCNRCRKLFDWSLNLSEMIRIHMFAMIRIHIGTTPEYSLHYHTAARLEFKSCLRPLGLGKWFDLGQSFVKLKSVGCIPQLPPLLHCWTVAYYPIAHNTLLLQQTWSVSKLWQSS